MHPTMAAAPDSSSEQSHRLRLEPWKHTVHLLEPHRALQHLCKDAAVVVRDGHAPRTSGGAVNGETLLRHARPRAENAATLDFFAQHHGGKTPAMIGAKRAVLLDAAAELGHHQHGHIGAKSLDVG